MPPKAETAIGLDVGGTRIRAARIGRDGAILDQMAEPTQRDRDGFSRQIARMAVALQDGSAVAVGAGLPGRVDASAQTVRSAGYLDIAGLDVAGALRAATGLPARIENDATMALIAEARMRAARGLVLMVTVGTGIGGAAILDGAPWYGGGFAGQFGHIAVAAEGPICNCGRRGCVETFSSGAALGRLLREAGRHEETRFEELDAAAEAGDAEAAALLAAWAAPFERALQSLTAVADPALILIGGGLGGAMASALSRVAQPSPWFGAPVETARLGDAAGVIGAGLAAFDAAARA
jgi:glucokinase